MSESRSSVHVSSCLFYILDPMCSWCYAFTDSLRALRQALPADVQIVYVLGGLAPDTEEAMSASMRIMIQQTWRKIEKMVPGIHFNHDFWICNTPRRSTYPACRAILAARKQHVAAELEMLEAIQTAYYQKAKNPSLPQVLRECAESIGLNGALFAADLASESIDAAFKQQLQVAAGLNAFSFPSLRLLHEQKLYSITVDYLDYRSMLNEINAVIA